MIAKCVHKFVCVRVYVWIFIFFISSQLLQVSLNPDGRTADWAENFTNTRFEEALKGAIFVSCKKAKNNSIIYPYIIWVYTVHITVCGQ